MRVIFLDCDGVLNNATTNARAGKWIGLDPVLLARFKALLARVDAKVVLSSTWRLIPELKAEVEAQIPIIDATPQVGSRGLDIRTWLAFHPEVERYAIIDDDRDMEPGQTAFFTTFEHGLTEDVADAVVAHLVGA